MMIIECSQAKLLFVSDTIGEVLNEEPKNWIGSCLYDLLHPKVRWAEFGRIFLKSLRLSIVTSFHMHRSGLHIT